MRALKADQKDKIWCQSDVIWRCGDTLKDMPFDGWQIIQAKRLMHQFFLLSNFALYRASCQIVLVMQSSEYLLEYQSRFQSEFMKWQHISHSLFLKYWHTSGMAGIPE